MFQAGAVGARADSGGVCRVLDCPRERRDRRWGRRGADRGVRRVVLGAFVYTVTATAGTAPRRRSAEEKRIERGVTIGPLLLWLDHRVSVPRYRSVGWALAIGPAILVIALSGTTLVATTGLGAGILFLCTGFAGFRDLARVRQVAQRARAEEIVVLASVGAPA